MIYDGFDTSQVVIAGFLPLTVFMKQQEQPCKGPSRYLRSVQGIKAGYHIYKLDNRDELILNFVCFYSSLKFMK